MTEVERTEKFLAWRSRRALVTGVLVAALMVSVAVNVGVWWQGQQTADNAIQNTVSFAQQVQDACADGGLPVDGRDLCPRADEIVEDPAAPPVPEPAENGDDATDAQVAAGVAAWFATHDLSLTPGYNEAMQAAVARSLSRNPPAPGKDGKDAAPPTDRQIAGAVATYLIAHPPADGSNGTDGRGVISSALDGCDVVFTYTDGGTDRVGPICGADGRDGADGADGTDGRGLVSTECLEDGDWLFTYTDDTTETTDGPCRVDPEPDPDPGPDPIIPAPEEG